MTESFPDIEYPTGRLNPPGDYSGTVGGAYEQIGGTIGLIDWAWTKVAGWSLMEKLMEPIAGDWGRLYELRDVWHNLHYALDDVSKNLIDGQYKVMEHWDGNAASAFDAYMAGLSLAVLSEHEIARFYRDKLDQLATTAEGTVTSVFSLLSFVANKFDPTSLKYAVPIWGQKKLYDDVHQLIHEVQAGLDAIQELTNVINALQGVTDLLSAARSSPGAPAVYEVPDQSYGGPTAPGI